MGMVMFVKEKLGVELGEQGKTSVWIGKGVREDRDGGNVLCFVRMSFWQRKESKTIYSIGKFQIAPQNLPLEQ